MSAECFYTGTDIGKSDAGRSKLRRCFGNIWCKAGKLRDFGSIIVQSELVEARVFYDG